MKLFITGFQSSIGMALAAEWESDSHYNRLHITSNPSGFLRRVPGSTTGPADV